MHRIQDALTSWGTGILGAYLPPVVLHNVYFFLRCAVFWEPLSTSEPGHSSCPCISPASTTHSVSVWYKD